MSLVKRAEHNAYVVFQFEPIGDQVANYRLQAKTPNGYDYTLSANRSSSSVATHTVTASKVSHRINVYTPMAWFKANVRLARFGALDADNNAARIVERMVYWIAAREFEDQPDWAYVLRSSAKLVLGDDYEV